MDAPPSLTIVDFRWDHVLSHIEMPNSSKAISSLVSSWVTSLLQKITQILLFQECNEIKTAIA